MSTEYEALKKAVEKKQQLIKKHSEELKSLLEDCPHEELEEKSNYFPGSYYDKAYTSYYNKCKLCGKTSETTYKDHSWYG